MPENSQPLFPYDTVVGVIDDATQLDSALAALHTEFAEGDVHVLCGPAGVRRIDPEGQRKGLLARLFRMVDDIGAEADQTERHVRELRDGHFVVVINTPNDAEVDHARDVLLAHSAHFVNHYTRWTTTQLAA